MAASALDPHLLVGLDAKRTPRARSFRERVRGVPSLRLGRLFARCARVPALTMAHDQTDHVRLISQKEDSRDAKTRLLDALDASSSRGKERSCAPLIRARA